MGYTTYPLLPEHAICLQVCDEDGNGDAFCQLFRDCWKRLPSTVAQQILDYWNTSERSPVIELSNQWRDSADSWAQVRLNGFVMRFNAMDFQVMPKSVAMFIIAHEIGHVFQKSQGRPPGGHDIDENEKNADDLAIAWGFDSGDLKLFQQCLINKMPLADACRFVSNFSA